MAHRGGHPHVHVIVNRLDAESGKAAGLSKSKLRLSKWAEGYEQGQGWPGSGPRSVRTGSDWRPPAYWPGPSRDARATW